jgi:hypothetical protein
LAAIQPGDGLVTWQGSPLWLSLAGIGKPAALGVLAAAMPGRVQIMRTQDGAWLVEHAGGLWVAPRMLGHEATAGDDEALLLDVLYGVAATLPESAALRRFEAAMAAQRFAGVLPRPAGWRAQEAWATAARYAVASGQRDSKPTAESRALQAVVAAVLDGSALAAAADPRGFPPVARDRCIAVALSGDAGGLAAALAGLGRFALEQVCRGRIEGIGPLETLGLAVCLGRLTGMVGGRRGGSAQPGARRIGVAPAANRSEARLVRGAMQP